MTIKAIAYETGWTSSAVISATYTVGSCSGWSINGGCWAKRKPITIAHVKVQGAPSNFPVLFSSTDPDFKSTANGGSVGRSDGLDILFADANGNKLNHEIESYGAVTGQLTAWVRVPSLSSGADTTLYVYFGNASASDQSNKPARGTATTRAYGIFQTSLPPACPIPRAAPTTPATTQQLRLPGRSAAD